MKLARPHGARHITPYMGICRGISSRLYGGGGQAVCVSVGGGGGVEKTGMQDETLRGKDEY